jgi:hypothetical protein
MTTELTGAFRWIPVEENGPCVPFDRPKICAFAHVDGRPDLEGALLIRALPEPGAAAEVLARWLPEYPVPHTEPGDVVTLVAAQRPIATITITAVSVSR